MKLKRVIRSWFPQIVDFRNRIYNDWTHNRFRGLPIQDVFTSIYRDNHWRGRRSVSGTGSDSEQTNEVRRILEGIIDQYEIASILDVPCGDFNWMNEVQFPNRMKYFGGDIVEELIISNKRKYSDNTRTFQWTDITCSPLPAIDLVFCRDCLVHFSYQDIDRAIANIKNSRSKYLLTTTFPNWKNRNIVSGNWRPINLQAAPFTFPTPLGIFNESCTENERYRDKSLALWKIQNL